MEHDISGRPILPFAPLMVARGAGEEFNTGRLDTRWKINGPQVSGSFSVIHHQFLPRETCELTKD
jgi:hypothetical protein